MKNFTLKLTRQELIILQDLVSQKRAKLNYTESAYPFEKEIVTKINNTFKKELNLKEKEPIIDYKKWAKIYVK
jgi:hypothetical protein